MGRKKGVGPCMALTPQILSQNLATAPTALGRTAHALSEKPAYGVSHCVDFPKYTEKRVSSHQAGSAAKETHASGSARAETETPSSPQHRCPAANCLFHAQQPPNRGPLSRGPARVGGRRRGQSFAFSPPATLEGTEACWEVTVLGPSATGHKRGSHHSSRERSSFTLIRWRSRG